ncbi:unnamed protein product, partial [Choristocarpus tenellus]
MGLIHTCATTPDKPLISKTHERWRLNVLRHKMWKQQTRLLTTNWILIFCFQGFASYFGLTNSTPLLFEGCLQLLYFETITHHINDLCPLLLLLRMLSVLW